ncbi:hypothetical protein CUR178_04014 [Leishmania enriettii]|uniref:Uncharacterized protein n=1 Tax=Leishmania enriettii TaxID=5663 RepID=A0A836KSP7_LEIEN|nr:hypothetical protein CUR178_04014 [Leishmania enriettii]
MDFGTQQSFQQYVESDCVGLVASVIDTEASIGRRYGAPHSFRGGGGEHGLCNVVHAYCFPVRPFHFPCDLGNPSRHRARSAAGRVAGGALPGCRDTVRSRSRRGRLAGGVRASQNAAVSHRPSCCRARPLLTACLECRDGVLREGVGGGYESRATLALRNTCMYVCVHCCEWYRR